MYAGEAESFKVGGLSYILLLVTVQSLFTRVSKRLRSAEV